MIDSDLCSRLADGGDAASRVARRFVMERHEVGSRLDEAAEVTFGFGYHQMHVQHLSRRAPQGFHHGKPERYVGYEYAVHDVDVDPFGRAAVYHADVAFEVAEIGR